MCSLFHCVSDLYGGHRSNQPYGSDTQFYRQHTLYRAPFYMISIYWVSVIYCEFSKISFKLSLRIVFFSTSQKPVIYVNKHIIVLLTLYNICFHEGTILFLWQSKTHVFFNFSCHVYISRSLVFTKTKHESGNKIYALFWI